MNIINQWKKSKATSRKIRSQPPPPPKKETPVVEYQRNHCKIHTTLTDTSVCESLDGCVNCKTCTRCQIQVVPIIDLEEKKQDG